MGISIDPKTGKMIKGDQGKSQGASDKFDLEVSAIENRWYVFETTGDTSVPLGSFRSSEDAIECIRIIRLLLQENRLYERGVVKGLLATIRNRQS
jgi:hypothetical protein